MRISERFAEIGAKRTLHHAEQIALHQLALADAYDEGARLKALRHKTSIMGHVALMEYSEVIESLFTPERDAISVVHKHDEMNTNIIEVHKSLKERKVA